MFALCTQVRIGAQCSAYATANDVNMSLSDDAPHRYTIIAIYTQHAFASDWLCCAVGVRDVYITQKVKPLYFGDSWTIFARCPCIDHQVTPPLDCTPGFHTSYRDLVASIENDGAIRPMLSTPMMPSNNVLLEISRSSRTHLQSLRLLNIGAPLLPATILSFFNKPSKPSAPIASSSSSMILSQLRSFELTDATLSVDYMNQLMNVAATQLHVLRLIRVSSTTGEAFLFLATSPTIAAAITTASASSSSATVVNHQLSLRIVHIADTPCSNTRYNISYTTTTRCHLSHACHVSW